MQKAAPVEKQQPAAATANQNPPPKHLSSKNLKSSFNESFISSGKQEGGATIFRESRDIETRETCLPTSLNANNFGKAAELHFAFFLSSAAGSMPNSACRSLSTTVLMTSSHRLLINQLPTG
jgi:hypothetical protein